MANPHVVLSRPAQTDLDDIWDYLAQQASPSIADFVIARFYEAFHRAAHQPLMYPQSEFPGRPRRINVFEYAIFYEPADGSGILVWRVVHGRRRLPPLVRRPN